MSTYEDDKALVGAGTNTNYIIGHSFNQMLGWTTHLFPVGQEDLEVHVSFKVLRIDPSTSLPSVCPHVCEGVAH